MIVSFTRSRLYALVCTVSFVTEHPRDGLTRDDHGADFSVAFSHSSQRHLWRCPQPDRDLPDCGRGSSGSSREQGRLLVVGRVGRIQQFVIPR